MGLVQQLLRGLWSRARTQPRRTQISRVSLMYSPELLCLPGPMATPSRERVGVLCAGNVPGRDSRQPPTPQEGSLGWAWLPCPVAAGTHPVLAGRQDSPCWTRTWAGGAAALLPQTPTPCQGTCLGIPLAQGSQYPPPCPATVLPAWCPHPCSRDTAHRRAADACALLLKSCSAFHVLGDSVPLPTQLSIC